MILDFGWGRSATTNGHQFTRISGRAGGAGLAEQLAEEDFVYSCSSYELPLVPVVVFHNLIEFFFWREISWDGVELRKEPKGIA